MKTTQKPCGECPFRKNALPGWLGPWKSAEELLRPVMGEVGFICHMSLQTDYDEARGIDESKHKLCAGSLICANKSFKSYRNPDLAAAQKKFGRDEGIMDQWEFVERHKKKLTPYVGSEREGEDLERQSQKWSTR